MEINETINKEIKIPLFAREKGAKPITIKDKPAAKIMPIKLVKNKSMAPNKSRKSRGQPA